MRLTISVIALTLLPASLALALTTNTVSFQNGVNSYSGTYDRYIAQTPDSGVDGSALADLPLIGMSQQGLIRFDNIFGNNPGQIPLGARIIDASLQFSTFGGSVTTEGTNGPYTVAGLTAPFNNTTTYATYSGGLGAWFENGHTTRPQGNYGRLDVGETQGADMRSIVQAWSDGGANNGVAVNGGNPTGTDDWHILTTGSTSPGSRPKLNVTYTTDGVAVNTFQRGLNGYANVDSVRVTSKCNTDGTGCATPGSYSNTDGNSIGSMTLQLADATSAEQFALFRFNDVFGSSAGQAAADKPVSKAFLVLTTLASSSTAARIPAPVDAYEVKSSPAAFGNFNDKQDVDAADYVTWRKNEAANAALTNDNAAGNQGARYTLWRSNFAKPFRTFDQFGANIGLQSGDGDIMQETLYRTPSAANDSEIWFDVTRYAEGIRNGATNNGIAIQARSTDGWQFVMNGTTAFDARRPRLVVMSDLASPVGPQPTTVLRYDPSPKNGVLTGAINNTTKPLPNLPSAPTPTGVTGLAMVRGSGLSDGSPATNRGLTNGFYAESWTIGGDVATAVANNNYYEWGFTLDATHTASLSALDLWVRRQLADAPNSFEVQASLDNFATAPIVLNDFTYMGHVDGDPPTIDPSLDTPFSYMTTDQAGRPDTTFSPSDPIPQINLSSVAALQNIAAGSTLKFRLYGWGATTDTGQFGFRINGPKLTGVVSAVPGLGSTAVVPEPGTIFLGVCASLFVAFRRRRLSA